MKKIILAIAIIIVSLTSQAQFLQKGSDIEGFSAEENLGTSVSLNSDGNYVAIGAPQSFATETGEVKVYNFDAVMGWLQVGTSIQGVSVGEDFGCSVSLSDDGQTVIVGADYGGSDSKGVARVFTFNGTDWVQKGSDIDGLATNDQFGYSIGISSDGNTVIIGAKHYQTAGENNGYASVYHFDSGSWVQMGSTIVGVGHSDYFGYSVSISDDGLTIGVGAPQNEGTAAGNAEKGYAKLFHYDGSSWSQLGNTLWGDADYDFFGGSISLNSDGTRTVVGVSQTSSQDLPKPPGYVKIYELDGGNWTSTGTITGQVNEELFGYSVSMSADGNRIIIGAPNNSDNGSNAGVSRLYMRSGGSWIQVDSDFSSLSGDVYGRSVSISSDGTTFASGGPLNSNTASGSGIVKVYETCNTENLFSVHVCDNYTSPSGNYVWNAAGTYLDTISNTNGCDSIMTITVSIAQNHPQDICMVTVDTTFNLNKNLIVWEKATSDSIDHYNIYKEITTDNYQLQGSVNYADISEYVDNNSEPSVHADKYKISVVDVCNHESIKSPFHQTMNLSQSQGAQTNEVVLTWNKYIDESGAFTPASYKIYRGVDPYNMILENTITGGLSSYNYNVQNVVNGEHFMVTVDMPECNPSINHASGGPYYQSSSNLEDEGVIDNINKLSSERINIFPNPMSDFTVIKSNKKIKSIRIYNIAGELLRNYDDLNINEFKINKRNLATGTYILEINKDFHQRLIVE